MKRIKGVLIKERLFSPAVCKALREIYERHGHLGRNRDYTMNQVLHLFDLERAGLKAEQEFLFKAVNYIHGTVCKWIRRHIYVEAAFLACLPEGGRHPLHRDNCLDTGAPNHTPQRDYSSLAYLNGDFEGGEIRFPGRGELKPKTGTFVAFPSGHDFPHEVPPVLFGKRYSLPVWFTFNPERRMFK